MKLELKHLAPYLPYGLKMQVKHSSLEYSVMTLCDKTGLSNIGISDVIDDIECFKPILRHLSDLTENEIRIMKNEFGCSYSKQEGLHFYYYEIGVNDYLESGYDATNKLLEWHFDVFELIPKGLAIDINIL